MTKLEYIRYAIQHGLFRKLDWYYEVFTLPTDIIDKRTYVKYDDGKWYVILEDNRTELITDAGLSILKPADKITLMANDLPTIKKDIETTVGMLVINYLLLSAAFGDKVEYINKYIGVRDIENKIILPNLDSGKITIDEYMTFTNNASMMVMLSDLFNVSATEGNIVEPPGIKKYKKELIAEMDKQYGVSWRKDGTKIKNFTDKLMAFADEHLKNDPSYDKLYSGKSKKGYVKMFLLYGQELGFGSQHDQEATLTSLSDGWPEDPDKLTSMFNSARAGSFSRGKETQFGGVVAKQVLRATNGVIIHPDKDCGSVVGKLILVNKYTAPHLIGRYQLINGKPVNLTKDMIDKLMDKEIYIRSVQYCHLDGNNRCGICAGDKISKYENSIPVMMTDISGFILTESLKKMHGTALSTVHYNPFMIS